MAFNKTDRPDYPAKKKGGMRRRYVFSAGKAICRQARSDGTVKGRKPAFMGSKNE